jgi:RNA polymerase sigma-70 factor (ECF subfamily)
MVESSEVEHVGARLAAVFEALEPGELTADPLSERRLQRRLKGAASVLRHKAARGRDLSRLNGGARRDELLRCQGLCWPAARVPAPEVVRATRKAGQLHRDATQPSGPLGSVPVTMEGVGSVAELFDREYVRLVRALAVAFDSESAADAVQAAFIIADRRWRRVSGYDDPAGWVRRVAINKLLSGQRNRRRRAEILATIRPVDDEDLTDDLLDLRRAIDALPTRMRLTVCLFYLADLGVDQVATTLEVSVGTVKSNLHDARKQLRSMLEDTA